MVERERGREGRREGRKIPSSHEEEVILAEPERSSVWQQFTVMGYISQESKHRQWEGKLITKNCGK
jgi:hypothetical protein